MYCPLTFKDDMQLQCVKGLCTWWCPIQEKCVMVAIADRLRELGEDLTVDEIKRKFPHLFKDD